MTIMLKNRLYTSLLLSALMLLTIPVKAQQVTISNNLLYDATLTPNLRVGLRLAPHWSMGVTAGYRPWPTDDHKEKKWKHLLVSPDVRYWTDSVNVHHFFGVNLIYAHFNIANVKFPFGLYKGFRNERRQGDLGALGAYYGYSWPLGRHWNIEALIGAAVGYTKYNRYECGQCGSKIGESRKWFVIPQAGLNIVFNIPGRPKKVVTPVEPIQPVVQTEPALPTEPELPVVEETVKERPIDVLVRENPILSHISEYKAYDRNQVVRRDPHAMFVYFKQSEVKIRPEWHNNQQVLDRIIEVIQKMQADGEGQICKIQIVGMASFDGPEKLNESIAKQRAWALKRHVQEILPIGDDQFDMAYGGEGWTDFRDQLEEVIAGGDEKSAELRQVIDIIDNEPNLTRREQKIKKLNSGRTYRYIRDHHLGEQRNSGYLRVYFDFVNDNK